MTIEEMINLLEEVKEFDDFFQYNPRYLEDFNIMIETLKQLPSVTPQPCNDILDKIKAEIEALPKTYPFAYHLGTYVKEDDVKMIIDKYNNKEVNE